MVLRRLDKCIIHIPYNRRMHLPTVELDAVISINLCTCGLVVSLMSVLVPTWFCLVLCSMVVGVV